ncbi:MAG: ABC transporter ATP-binding protein [Chloroflexi bacterium]|nr:ABC transporter ATP-binding protein [Chloroflexota bacterium]
MIETHGLAKSFDGNQAVQDLNLQVKPGEIFAFLGPNGAGKTTTTRMLACLIAPTSGEARVAGYQVGRENDEIRARIGILTESPGLYEKLSAAQNLAFFARLYGLSNSESADAVKKHLGMLSLWERRDEAVAGFSKGMKQKLAIARALLHNPKVIFLDEPTSALDPEAAKIVRDFIAELKNEGRTIFLCTHNLDEADRLADRIGVMKQRLVQVDTAENLRRKLYGRSIVIRMRQVSETHVKSVKAFDFVKGIEREENQLSVVLDDPDAMTPAIVRALVNAGGEIQSVGEEKHSLEEVYLNLVGNNKG